ncbi:MAG TPA: 4a-hydroxytetrahydrobiopterin dehydratase [Thermoanaerobaculia bacterium]|nr:4a-hydroxytetrahydrobiopterin dehydratase [Thermoanaerobaculia bacterium]
MSDHANDETHTDEAGFELEAETGELRPERFGQRVEREDLGGLPEELPAWRLTEDEALLRTWRFPDAATAAAFAHFVATYGAAAGGSPVVRNYRHQVTVRLATPPAGGVTDGDVDLARGLGAAG